MTELLKALCAIDGVSSREEAVREWIRARVAPHADELREDAMGNLMVFKKGGRDPGRTIMVCAHMDEVGLMVTHVTDDGYLRFGTVGGIDRRLLPGRRVRVGERAVPGVIGLKARHLADDEEAKRVPKIKDMTIDIGAENREEALGLVSPGDVCAFDTEPEEFGEGMIKAKAIDDRLGCAVMIKLIEEGPPADAWFVFSAQEETGTRGAFGAAYALKPEIALILEGTTAADRPDLEGTKRVCAPGEGVVLSYMDGGAHYDRKLFERLREMADREGIRWQLKRTVAGGTDAAAIQRSRAGVYSTGISAAVRYIHSPASVASIADIGDVHRLARVFLEDLGRG